MTKKNKSNLLSAFPYKLSYWLFVVMYWIQTDKTYPYICDRNGSALICSLCTQNELAWWYCKDVDGADTGTVADEYNSRFNVADCTNACNFFTCCNVFRWKSKTVNVASAIVMVVVVQFNRGTQWYRCDHSDNIQW